MEVDLLEFSGSRASRQESKEAAASEEGNHLCVYCFQAPKLLATLLSDPSLQVCHS